MPFPPSPLEAAKGLLLKARALDVPHRYARRRRAEEGVCSRDVGRPAGPARAPPPDRGPALSKMAPPRSTGVDSRVSHRPTRRGGARLLGVAPAQLDPAPRGPPHAAPPAPRAAAVPGRSLRRAHRRPVHKSTAVRRFSSGGDASRRFDLCRRRGPSLPLRFPLAPPQVRPPALARVNVASSCFPPRDDHDFRVPMNDLRLRRSESPPHDSVVGADASGVRGARHATVAVLRRRRRRRVR